MAYWKVVFILCLLPTTVPTSFTLQGGGGGGGGGGSDKLVCKRIS